jgi:hypothetical protein
MSEAGSRCITTGFLVKPESQGQPKLGGTTDATAFVPNGTNAVFVKHKEKHMDTTFATEEQTIHIQEQEAEALEDMRRPAEQVLAEQREQGERPSLFVP